MQHLNIQVLKTYKYYKFFQFQYTYYDAILDLIYSMLVVVVLFGIVFKEKCRYTF